MEALKNTHITSHEAAPPPPPPHQGNGSTVHQNQMSTPNKKSVGVILMKYKECLKNHAASIGGNARDGCGEFMPNGEEGSIEALKCSACNCHRNFHRKHILHDLNDLHDHELYSSSCDPMGGGGGGRKGWAHNDTIIVGPRLQGCYMGYKNSGSVVVSESDEKDHHHHLHHHHRDEQYNGKVMMMMRKRFRTKFTQEQKEKLLGFAEKAEWKIQKLDESDVQNFCQEIGIKRRVLKVWMHNNKKHFCKQIITP